MKTIKFTLIILLLNLAYNATAQVDFDTYFVDKTMRIDYYHIGNAEEEQVIIDYIYNYGSWAGSLVNLIDPLKNGAYQYRI